MLAAERGRRQKWSSDPQNAAWSKDESRFGVKMLEKMGWAKGKGLGSSEDGAIAPIKAVYKCDNRGVGFTAKHDNNWVAHQDGFASLLSDLNSNVATSVKAEDTEIFVSNLEQMSKVQKRVHYKKFARGKDLSNYRPADMAAIFGSGVSQSAPVTPVNMSENEDSSDDVLSCPEVEPDELTKRKSKQKSKHCKKKEKKSVQEADFAVTSQYNMHEYFKMRMEKMKMPTVSSVSVSLSPNVLANEEKNIEIANESSVKVKKKKKKRKMDAMERSVSEDSKSCCTSKQDISDITQTTANALRKEKKRKNKSKDETEVKKLCKTQDI